MRRIIQLALIILFYCLIFDGVSAQEPTPTQPVGSGPIITSPVASITYPSQGQVIQGVVTVLGSSAVKSFSSAELTFSYENNPTNTWFLIQPQVDPVVNGPLAEWDTTIISDGVYTLRLVVSLVDGSQKVASVSGLRIHNYTPVETDDSAADTNTPTSQEVEITLATLPVTAKILPTNPASFTHQDVVGSLAKGVFTVMGLFATIGLIISFRSRRYRSP